MSDYLETNVGTIKKQAYRFGQLNPLNMAFAANGGGAYEAKNKLFEIQVNENGQIIKATQTNTLGFASDGTPRTDKVATIFIYNEKGDIKQQIYDYDDDGTYEYTYDFDCVYDENNELISHEETTWSKLKNGCKRFFGIEEREHGPKDSFAK